MNSVAMNLVGVLLAFTSFVVVLCKGQDITEEEDLYRCRQMCYTNFLQDWHYCLDDEECKNCWNDCDDKLAPFPLTVTSASKQGPLVLTDIEWNPIISNASKQCLITWEISGGGLMGNLLTDSSKVELSLWADKVYHIQVTCNNKDKDMVRKSHKLIVDTRRINGEPSSSTSSSPTESSTVISNNDVLATELNSKYSKLSKTKKMKSKLKSIELQKSFEKITTSHIPYVIRTKIIPENRDTQDLYARYIIYGMMGSLALILGTVYFYILLKPSKDEQPIEKENLISSGELCQDGRVLHV